MSDIFGQEFLVRRELESWAKPDLDAFGGSLWHLFGKSGKDGTRSGDAIESFKKTGTKQGGSKTFRIVRVDP